MPTQPPPTTEPLWGIHAGATGEAHTLFHNHNCIALGWETFGDLSALPPDREAFKTEYTRLYPGKVDKLIHFGRVTAKAKEMLGPLQIRA